MGTYLASKLVLSSWKYLDYVPQQKQADEKIVCR